MMRRLAICLLLLAPIGAVACSSSGGDDDAGGSGDDSSTTAAAPSGGSDDDTIYCDSVQAVMDLYNDNVDPSLSADEGRAALLAEHQDEVSDLFGTAVENAPTAIYDALRTTLLQPAEATPEDQQAVDDYNQDECGVDTSALTG